MTDLLERIRRSRLPEAKERRDIRTKAGATLREVGAFLQVSPMTVARWERGAEPRRDNAISYRQLLDQLRHVAAHE